MNKKALIGISLAIATLSTLSFAATKVGKMDQASFATVQAAVKANDYSSLPDDVKTNLTEEKFNDIVAKQAEHASLEASIEAGDYVAFKNAMIAQIPTEAEFQTMVTEHKTRAEFQTKIEAAVKANDFAAFKSAQAAQKAQMEANRPEGAAGNKTRPEPTDAQLQARFDEMVKYYTENGTLPGKMGGGSSFGGGFGGGRGGHGGGHGGPQGGIRGE